MAETKPNKSEMQRAIQNDWKAVSIYFQQRKKDEFEFSILLLLFHFILLFLNSFPNAVYGKKIVHT